MTSHPWQLWEQVRQRGTAGGRSSLLKRLEESTHLKTGVGGKSISTIKVASQIGP